MAVTRRCTRPKKGKQWHSGTKAYLGVDKHSGLAHTLPTTAANVSDISRAANDPRNSS